MKPFFHVLSLIVTISAVSAANMAIARFEAGSSAGATGYVKVYGGIVEVSLDLTNFNFTANTTGGLSYHIHVKFNNLGNKNSSFGPSCGGTNTGGHYDPWFACAPPSDQPLCNTNQLLTCITAKPANYRCTTALFKSSPLTACEVGDWSGKYGKVMPIAANSMVFRSNSTTAVNPPSRYEISASYLVRTKRSVVIHDSTGARILCAKFVNGSMTPNDRAPVEGILEASYAGVVALANFTSIGGPTVQIGGGEIKIGASGSTAFVGGCTGSMFSAYVTNKLARDFGTIPTNDSACGTRSTNLIIDTTTSCIPNSSKGAQCSVLPNGMSVRCANLTANNTFNYDVVSAESLYNVAQGSFSINLTNWQNTITVPLVSNSDFVGRALVLECASNTTIRRCASITRPPAVSRPTTGSPTISTSASSTVPPNRQASTSTTAMATTMSAGMVNVMAIVTKLFIALVAAIM